MAAKAKRAAAAPRYPEVKWGPFHGGVGVAVFLNEAESDAGPKFFRSVVIAPRRYRDGQGKWQDAGSLRVNDLPSLILALQAAHEHCLSVPLPGQAAEEEHNEDPAILENGKPPF